MLLDEAGKRILGRQTIQRATSAAFVCKTGICKTGLSKTGISKAGLSKTDVCKTDVCKTSPSHGHLPNFRHCACTCRSGAGIRSIGARYRSPRHAGRFEGCLREAKAPGGAGRRATLACPRTGRTRHTFAE